MNYNTKSSITLPPEEFSLVRKLRSRLKLKSNVAVVRAGLKLLAETTDRDALREQFRRASEATRASVQEEMAELDHLSGEGLD